MLQGKGEGRGSCSCERYHLSTIRITSTMDHVHRVWVGEGELVSGYVAWRGEGKGREWTMDPVCASAARATEGF